jgi:hypothetical protein
MELREGEKEKEIESDSLISQNIASVKVEDIRICFENC